MTTATDKKKSSKVTKFYSRGHGQRVTLKSPEVRYDERGNRIEIGGTVAEFDNGFWETDDSELADIMREREGFNLDFFEEGNEPGALKPSEPDALAAIIEATAAQDAEKVETVLAEEKATHNRPAVIGAATTALANVRKAIEAGVPNSEDRVVADEVVDPPRESVAEGETPAEDEKKK
jgi:hypothetical protein